MSPPAPPDLPSSRARDRRDPSWHPSLVASAVTAAAAAGLLGLGRVYDSLPLHPPPCSLRTLTGIPCVGCGGTRAIQALSRGDFPTALAFNPLAAAAVLAAFAWFAATWIRHRLGLPARRGPRVPLPWMVGGVILLLASNWVYLIFHLPR